MSKLPNDVVILGDPHLGRKFKTGVPFHRLGDREESVWRDFEASLRSVKPDQVHVNMGDLFDKFVVPPEVVLRAAQLYLDAARSVDAMFVVLEGNHDRSKDTSKQSSFDVFAALVQHQDNIMVVQDRALTWGDLGFVPYHPFIPTEVIVSELSDNLSAVFGHWDITDWGGHNIIPTEQLAQKGITLAISGHEHLPREETRHGVQIIGTGSMQPYTHAEDATGEHYVTLTLDEIGKGTHLRHKNVRVLLKEGETLPVGLDCLSITAKRVTDETERLEVDTSEFESISMGEMLAVALGDLTIKDDLVAYFEEVSQ